LVDFKPRGHQDDVHGATRKVIGRDWLVKATRSDTIRTLVQRKMNGNFPIPQLEPYAEVYPNAHANDGVIRIC